MAFKDRLKQAAIAAGLKQEDLAIKLSVSQPSVSAWLRGKSMPDVGRVSQLAEILNVPLQWLMDGSAPMAGGAQSQSGARTTNGRTRMLHDPAANAALTLLLSLPRDVAYELVNIFFAETAGISFPPTKPPDDDV